MCLTEMCVICTGFSLLFPHNHECKHWLLAGVDNNNDILHVSPILTRESRSGSRLRQAILSDIGMDISAPV